ncbi:hypothetical protein ACLBWP_17640 [Microbacterium sp. M1A1_1b]|uniref:hypothetical protein n=1 Tax=Curtobacterium sp. VKM Ac-2922 TaxID=2929475 RepID=UPI001FB22994|nr:hypothetical protein [Curtobacterium sp. VKM Ac-2922]MCJ1715939.1 hypothetical protein [Curtobacterium sp. VKM Ac-2922]
MSASNYLPPFNADERVAASGGDADTDAEPRPGARGVAARERTGTATATDAEVTYADFLGDQVED